MTRRFSLFRYRSVAATLGFIVPLALSVAGCSTVSSVFGGEPEQAEAPPPGQENTAVTGDSAFATTESRAASTRARSQGLVAAAPAARADAKGTTASDGSAVRYAPYVPRQGSSGKSLALKPATPPPAPQPVPDPEVTRVAEAEPSQPVANMPAAGPRSQPVPDPEVTKVAEPEPAAPVVKAEPLPDATAPQVAAQNPQAAPSPAAGQARDDGPSAPPARVNTQPPAPVQRGPMDTFEEQYRQRLAQSAASTSDPARTPPLTSRRSDDLYPPSATLRDEPIHLVPPSGHATAKAEPTPVATAPLATFQVAHVVFKPRTSQLTPADRAALKDVVQLYKKERGQVRILAYGSAADPWARADSIAAELVKQGIPAKAILVGADEAAIGDGGATVFFDIL